jgi:quercetin dioxygenase-like cupin family protein
VGHPDVKGWRVDPRSTVSEALPSEGSERERDVSGAGEVLENPISGQQITIRRTARETGGEFLEVESVYTKPVVHRPPDHYHPYQEERFEVISGTLRVGVEGEELELREGDVLVVPPGTTHGMWSETAGTRVNWKTYPAMDTEGFFRIVWGLAADGKTNRKGVPNLLQMAIIAGRYRGEFRLAKPSPLVQDLIFGALSPIGRLVGYRDHYPEHAAGEVSERVEAGQ